MLVIITLISSTSCTNNSDKKTELFSLFLSNQLNANLKDSANYLIITYMGCTGCVHKGVNYINRYPQYITLNYEKVIYSNTLLNRIPEIGVFKRNSVCDTSDRIEYLNLGLSGFSIIKIRKGIISEIINLDIRDTKDDSALKNYILMN